MNNLVNWYKRPLTQQRIKGLGKVSLAKLGAVGVARTYDLLRWLPREYLDYSVIQSIGSLKEGTRVHVQGQILSAQQSRTHRQKIPVFEILVDDGSGSIRAVWFGQKYLQNRLDKGVRVALQGSVSMDYHGMTLSNPQFVVLKDNQELAGEIQPVYRRIGGISSEKIRDWISQLLEQMPKGEWIPAEICEFFSKETGCLLPALQVFQTLHSPATSTILEELSYRENPYRRRLILEELLLFLFQSELVMKKIKQGGFPVLNQLPQVLREWEDSLPFALTSDQIESMNAVAEDLGKGKRVFSLVQGDVGSGKTVVALGICLMFFRNEMQSAMLCPTTVLAAQHFETASKLLEAFGVRVALLSSELDRKQQQVILEDLQRGEIDLVIGTHRILQGDVFFKNLGLIVIDEQHRFGVNQRLELLKKGKRPHLLSLTATPIPRSLAHSVYSGFEVLQIRQKPAGRKDVHTILKKSTNRESIIPFIQQKLSEGDQVFWVFPFIEGGSEDQEEQSVEYMSEQISKTYFPGVATKRLHGRMDKAELHEIMQKFRQKDISILFSTTVIEVGVDIANATLMIIEGAQHFGLSQLHQLRGRVGRGHKTAFCILFIDEPVAKETLSRMRFFESCHDGFELAEFDLKQRGAGDLFGVRQSGQDQMKFADLWLDRHVYEQMRLELPPLLNKIPRDDLTAMKELLF